MSPEIVDRVLPCKNDVPPRRQVDLVRALEISAMNEERANANAELANTRNQLARTETALRTSRRAEAELAKENTLLRAKVAMLHDQTVPAESYEDLKRAHNELDKAYADLEQRFIAQGEDLLARTNSEIAELSNLLNAVRSSKFWAAKEAVASLRRRRGV